MAESRNFLYFFIRYVPGFEEGTFVNIGVVLLDGESQGEQYAKARFMEDWTRVRRLDPDADVEELQQWADSVARRIEDPATRAEMFHEMKESWSNAYIASQTSGILAETPEEALDTLASQYLDLSRG